MALDIANHNIDYNDDESPIQYKEQEPSTTGLDDFTREICNGDHKIRKLDGQPCYDDWETF